MRILLAMLAVGCAVGMISAPAVAYDGLMFSVQAQGYGGGRGGGREGRHVRDAHVVQQAPQPPANRERPRGQLTDEERRQLHRDLDKANRELYRGRR